MRIIATLPTYNEAENIAPLIDEILGLGDEYEALVIDDDSPDGTWKIVQDKQLTNPRVHLLRRIGRRGRGTAGLEGFLNAKNELNADIVIEMDADFSHAPRFIPSLVAPIRDGETDIVIGSRLVKNGGEVGRSPIRKYITLGANAYIRMMLGLSIHDCTSGFRGFSRQALNTLEWDKMQCSGPEIVQEILANAKCHNLRMTERPILFEERRAGSSTFNAKIMLRSLLYMWKLRARARHNH
ncbi:polyprenol monophosphomannose synthase [Candidatus Sumerlaeota bacterium]|nr:polyprenol monophosphomannose synthase [Candidatus Sumerlaeota bacterium]